MIPEWMKQTDTYMPSNGRNTFILKTLKNLGKAMAKIRVQKGHEKKRALPAPVKLILLLLVVVIISMSQNKLILLGISAILLAYLSTWNGRDILNILKPGFVAAIIALIILTPAMITNRNGIENNLILTAKVFTSVSWVSIFNHTTQWNHITGALKKLHIHGIFIFILDVTLKYIVLLGNLITDLLTSLQIRSVGKNNKKYTTVGGVMGVTFLRSVEMNRQMCEAMKCRGFTDDYEGLNK